MLDALQRMVRQAGYGTDVQTFFVFFALIFARLATALSMSPFLGGQSVPGRVKTGLAVAIAAVIYPGLSLQAPAQPLASIEFVSLAIKEVVIGAVLGLVSQMVFFAVQSAGILIDTQRGMNQMNFVAPQLPGNVSILGSLKFQAALTLFLTLNGHLFFINALQRSFVILPATQFPHLSRGVIPLADQFARLTSDVFVIGLQLSAPVLVALFLIDVAFGAIGKVAPQINVHSESQPVKALAGLGVFLLASSVLLDRYREFFERMIASVYQTMRAWG